MLGNKVLVAFRCDIKPWGLPDMIVQNDSFRRVVEMSVPCYALRLKMVGQAALNGYTFCCGGTQDGGSLVQNHNLHT